MDRWTEATALLPMQMQSVIKDFYEAFNTIFGKSEHKAQTEIRNTNQK